MLVRFSSLRAGSHCRCYKRCGTSGEAASLRGRRTKGREGEVECERKARREREARSLGARRPNDIKLKIKVSS